MFDPGSVSLILWDFDGVILDSMAVREDGFRQVLNEFDQEKVDRLIVYHRENGGLSRYVKFRYFFEQILGIPVTEEKVYALAAEFSVIMKRMLANPTYLISDSCEFIRDYYQAIPMHIVSGSDHQELNYLCRELKIANFFKTINGSPTPKAELIRIILQHEEIDPSTVVLIGDSRNDYEAAVENSITFIGYNNTALQAHHRYISELSVYNKKYRNQAWYYGI